MAPLAQNTSLSLSTRLLLYLGPPSTILLTAAVSPKSGLLTPLVFVPTAWFYQKWKRFNTADPSSRGELQPMIWTYAATGTVGLAGAAISQIVLLKGLSALIFNSRQMADDFWAEFARTTIGGLSPDELTKRALIAASWQNWVMNGVFTFVGAGLVEETLKYLPIIYARRRGTDAERARRKRAYIDHALAGALGFGVIEGIGCIYGACNTSGETWQRLLLTTFERAVIGSLAHLMGAALTALRATRRDHLGDRMSWWAVIGPSVLYHGMWDFVALSASALEGNVGWIHPRSIKVTGMMFGLLSALLATLTQQLRGEWHEIETREVATNVPADTKDTKRTE